MIRKLSFLAIIWILAPLTAEAEGGCQPGQYPQQGQGWQTCVPIPGQQGSSQTTLPAPVQWGSRWQAIVTDADKGALGTSTGAATEQDAIRSATSDCSAKGGRSCELQISASNGCVAMAVGAKRMLTRAAMTKEEAESLSVKACNMQDENCSVYYSACSLPARIK